MQRLMRQRLFGLLALADIGQRTGEQMLTIQIRRHHRANHHPDQTPPAVAQLALVMQKRLTSFQMRLHRRHKAAALTLRDQGSPVIQGARGASSIQAKHGQPALGQMQAIFLYMPLPQTIVGTTHCAGIAILARLQGLLVGGDIGIGGQGDIEERRLEQAAIKLFGQLGLGMPVPANRLVHEVEIEVKGRQIPFQINPETLVGQPDQHPQAHVLHIVGSAQQLSKIGLLLALEALHAARLGEHRSAALKATQMNK